MTFDELGLHEDILQALDYMNFKEATPIQVQAIPQILENKDMIACAQTGTGKTGAFILPILHKIASLQLQRTTTLIIVPTRELALQIDTQIQGLAYFTGATSICLYGGGKSGDLREHKQAFEQGVDIVIATPGKLLSYLITKVFDTSGIQFLVLDEADRMLDMGFYDDISRVISYLPEKRQNLLFSATMSPKIRSLAKTLLHDPYEISLAISKPAESITQLIYLAHEDQKIPLLNQLLAEREHYTSILIFSSTIRKVDKILRELNKNGHKAEGISSDYEQSERESKLLAFGNKELRIVVATDVLSRGIDIKDINLVVNFDVPPNPEDYVHRIGRTARAATKGEAITFVSADDMHKFARIEKLIERELDKLPVPAELGEGPAWNPRHSSGNRPNGKKKFFKRSKS
jgi:superfamily II DNA/RNA helicase